MTSPYWTNNHPNHSCHTTQLAPQLLFPSWPQRFRWLCLSLFLLLLCLCLCLWKACHLLPLLEPFGLLQISLFAGFLSALCHRLEPSNRPVHLGSRLELQSNPSLNIGREFILNLTVCKACLVELEMCLKLHGQMDSMMFSGVLIQSSSASISFTSVFMLSDLQRSTLQPLNNGWTMHWTKRCPAATSIALKDHTACIASVSL